MYNTEVGYCQGMSQIAAILLMYLNDEEDVFWALSQLMSHPKYAMHGKGSFVTSFINAPLDSSENNLASMLLSVFRYFPGGNFSGRGGGTLVSFTWKDETMQNS